MGNPQDAPCVDYCELISRQFFFGVCSLFPNMEHNFQPRHRGGTSDFKQAHCLVKVPWQESCIKDCSYFSTATVTQKERDLTSFLSLNLMTSAQIFYTVTAEILWQAFQLAEIFNFALNLHTTPKVKFKCENFGCSRLWDFCFGSKFLDSNQFLVMNFAVSYMTYLE